MTLNKIGIVTGLQREAECFRSNYVVCAGANSNKAYELSTKLAVNGCTSLISFGIAGGLAPNLKPGAVVIGKKVLGKENSGIETDISMRQKLAEIIPDSLVGSIYSSPRAVADVSEKAAIFSKYNALAADMESLAIGVAATENHLPFSIVRIVADPASQQLPDFAFNAIDPNGNARIGPVMVGLIKNPIEIANLVRLVRNSNKAFRQLRRVALLIGFEFGF